MKEQQIQMQKGLDAKLNKITKLLEIVVVELKEAGTSLRLTKKTERAIDRGLKELKTGKYTEYKDVASFRKALG